MAAMIETDEIWAGEARFRAVQDASPIGFALHRPVREDGLSDGRVVDFSVPYINEAGARVVRQPRARIMASTLRSIFPGTGPDGVFADYVRVLETGEPLYRELSYEHDELHAGLAITAVRIGEGTDAEIGVTFVDITDRLRAERERAQLLAEQVRARQEVERLLAESERARERTAILQQLTEALSTASTADQVADAVVSLAARVIGAVGTVVARVTPDGEQLEILGAGDMPDAIREDWRRFPIDAPVPLAEVARTGCPVFLESRAAWAARYPGMEPLLKATGHHANAVLPLVVNGRALGVIGAAFSEPREFDEDDRTLALAVAQQCAQALDRARLFEAERAASAERRRLLEEAEAANRAKSEFLAVMSHELRTPLNAIGGYVQLLEMEIHGPITGKQREDLRRVQASQRHLLGLINEVLNYAKLETGTVHYDIAVLHLQEALAGAELLVAPQAQSKGLALDVAPCPPDLRVRADPEKLRQILVNLLSNAVKFTDRGGCVSIACVGDEVSVGVRVRDTGIGIPADKLEAVFEPFVQVRADLTRPHQGTGLGLAISRDLARGMGGDLTVESTIGQGSAFTLTLPRG